MKLAIIDLGSNTIRTVTYLIDGNESEILTNNGVFAKVVSYIRNGKMTNEGIDKIVTVLNKAKQETIDCDYRICFATASLRFISNRNEVADIIRNRTDIDIRLLEAEQEAYYDYIGLSEIAESGIGGDLGGGSCQLFSFNSEGLLYSCSMPVGGLRLYTEFVHGILPDKDEIAKIRQKVQTELSFHKKLSKTKELFMSGGSIRNIVKFAGQDGFCKKEDFDRLCALCENNPDECEDLLKQHSKERLVTIIPATVVLSEICNFLGTDKIIAVDVGVRDGILKEFCEKMIKSGN